MSANVPKRKSSAPRKKSDLSSGIEKLKINVSRGESSGAANRARRSSTTPQNTVFKARRRLSVVDGAQGGRLTRIDGAASIASPALGGKKIRDYLNEEEKDHVSKSLFQPKPQEPVKPFATNAHITKTGYVPFNPEKVNQDRPLELHPFGGDVSKALFGAFDGHGSLGHEVSTFVSSKLPLFILKQDDLKENTEAAMKRAFVECNSKLAKSKIDCTFSGTTAVVVYLDDQKLWCCNTGDSRAVLAQSTGSPDTYKAVDLSDDQKPDRPDEAKRIIASKGRVAACKGMGGEDIGPARVWLLHQDVPGLAMTRSFGDLIAASVGVIPEPEVLSRDRHESDSFMILASDGVWEFITSQEAVDMISKCKSPEKAAKILCDESTRRWKDEEEVIDDITAVVVYF